MDATKRSPEPRAEKGLHERSWTRKGILMAVALGLSVGCGYAVFKNLGSVTAFLVPHFPTSQPNVVVTNSPAKPLQTDIRLTREGIDRLLEALDDAVRRKDVDGILRHITHDATITIHLKQGPQQQLAMLTREDYRKTLAMTFAFGSANDFTRTNTTVSLASDERTAKVSFKSTETLRQANREFKTEGEETIVFGLRDGKPMITALEQTFPGDST